MSDLLSIGASGVRAYQSALTTVSENIANTGTVGYSRRSTLLSEVGASVSSVDGRITSGNGVAVKGVARAADDFKSAAARSAGSDLAKTDSSITWLDQIDGALTGNQLGARITSFFTATRALAGDPSATTPRDAVLQAASTAAAAFTATGHALDQASANLDQTARQAVQSLDDLSASLAKVNDQLGRSSPGTTISAQLLDQRDQILDQISALADVDVKTDAIGRTTLRLGGQGGPVLVTGVESGHVTYSRNSEGAVQFAVQRAGTANAAALSGGALAGIVDGAARIADARATLSQIAGDFVTGVNAVQAQGRDLNGAPGAPLFAAGASPTDISVVLDDPNGIAAAGVGGGARDNSNLAAFETIRSGYGFEAKVTALVTANGATLGQRKSVAEAQNSIRDNAVASLGSATGVNLDSEAVDLLRFQQAYSASSRVIQVARDTFQSMIEIR